EELREVCEPHEVEPVAPVPVVEAHEHRVHDRVDRNERKHHHHGREIPVRPLAPPPPGPNPVERGDVASLNGRVHTLPAGGDRGRPRRLGVGPPPGLPLSYPKSCSNCACAAAMTSWGFFPCAICCIAFTMTRAPSFQPSFITAVGRDVAIAVETASTYWGTSASV